MSILIDKRVGSEDLAQPLSLIVNAQVKLTTLEAGDVCFMGNGPNGEMSIGLERKRIRDLVNSMRSGRYTADQLIKMGETYDLSILLVEGIFRPGDTGLLEVLSGNGWQALTYMKSGQYRYSEVDNFLTMLEMKKNIIVKRSGSRDETIHQIAGMYNLFQKDWESHHSTEAIKTQVGSVFRKASVLRMVAAQLPGIGWGRSKKVEEKFGTINQMVRATVEEWAEIDGIGDKTAKKVVEAIRGKKP